jgi:plasmid stabilization system protein ParE
MRIRFARRAEKDLLEIAQWIATDNPARALSFTKELREKCRSLAVRPARFPVVRLVRDEEVRKLSYRGYLILYVIRADAVGIDRIVHGSRDWMRLLGSNE